jgi:hypothetical protein
MDIIFFIYILIDDKGITSKTLKINVFIEWDNIKSINIYDAGTSMYKNCIMIVDTSNSIKISNWTHNSKELIKIVVDECKKRDIKVELMVEKIVED